MTKSKSKSIKVVQFLHSGKEYKRSEFKVEGEKTIKPWNTGDHKRKFLHAKGAYIDAGKIIGNENNWEDIYFWGEWEPESIAPNINKHGEDAPPHFIHEPFLRLNESGQLIKGDKKSIAKNTDPFVFGDKGFFYSCCMQSRYKKLQDLEPGSIILFGSNINHNKDNAYFALDTVFVVGDDKNKLEYYKNTDLSELQKFGPKHYCDIMNYTSSENNSNPSCNGNEQKDCNGSNCTSNKSEPEGCEKGPKFTCYRGASFDPRVKGMYSFVPCKIGTESENGFERVMLTKDSFKDIFDEEIISNNLTQGVKYTEVTLGESFDIWNTLCSIIKSQGFEKAVRLDYTEKKE